MSILDETLEKAKEVFGAVEQKTTDFTKLQKLKIKAIGVDSEISKLFQKLGKEYYKELKKSDELKEKYEPIYVEITQKLAELQKLKDEITLRQGGVICNECGHLNLDKSVYCAKCGARI